MFLEIFTNAAIRVNVIDDIKEVISM